MADLSDLASFADAAKKIGPHFAGATALVGAFMALLHHPHLALAFFAFALLFALALCGLHAYSLYLGRSADISFGPLRFKTGAMAEKKEKAERKAKSAAKADTTPKDKSA